VRDPQESTTKEPGVRHWYGARPEAGGVHYRVWAPGCDRVTARIEGIDGRERELTLQAEAEEFYDAFDPEGKVGDRYRWMVDGEGPFPDPASHFQPEGVHGPSQVIEHHYKWQHPRPPLDPRRLVIYELHIGTFTEAGTFAAATEKLVHLKELGINAIEIMPLADFPGDRNWGYDGVMLYAPARAYGKPEELRHLVDIAHGLGLHVFLDVVYNHFGPDGNYLWALSGKGFFRHDRKTPWGDAINYDGQDGRPVRDFFLGNISHWMEHFGFDGFRLDATHEIRDESERHLLAEIADLVRGRGGWVVAEDDRNEHRLCLPEIEGGLGLNAVWADDFHHVVRVALTGSRESYFGNYTGSAEELQAILQGGWLYRGQKLVTVERKRGTAPEVLDPAQFVHCISNHDQTGNRAFGERLHHLVDPVAHEVALALLLLGPYTPMLFMGDEWACSSPFLFFTDHHDELGRQVTAGRRREFGQFKAFQDPKMRAKIPDPQDDAVFRRSQLPWAEREQSPHRQVWERVQAMLTLREALLPDLPRERGEWSAEAVGEHAVQVHYDRAGGTPVTFWCALSGSGEIPIREGEVLFECGEFEREGTTLRHQGPFLLLIKNHGASGANVPSSA